MDESVESAAPLLSTSNGVTHISGYGVRQAGSREQQGTASGTKDCVREDVKNNAEKRLSAGVRVCIFGMRECAHVSVRLSIFGHHCRVVNVKELVLKVRHDAALW